jgi:cellulose biosynthesis protein BcsQ
MWKSYDTEFQGTLQSLRRHKELVERRASVIQYRIYRDDMETLKAKLADQVEAEKLKKLVVIREWLAVGQQPIDDHAEYMKVRQKYSATAKWILDRDAVKQWTGNTNPASPCRFLPYSLIDLSPTNTASSIVGTWYSRGG